MKHIYIIFKDGEVFECHGSYEKAEARYELRVYNDLEQAHTWSMSAHELLSDETIGDWVMWNIKDNEPCGECHLKPGERCDICGKLYQRDL